ncbi:MAG: hypothetical protein PF693_01020 [Spirochaetia bacterium]|jgi:hypothetical protein|nr:hypothetical protein [Spirochaetia bacterium]
MNKAEINANLQILDKNIILLKGLINTEINGFLNRPFEGCLKNRCTVSRGNNHLIFDYDDTTYIAIFNILRENNSVNIGEMKIKIEFFLRNNNYDEGKCYIEDINLNYCLFMDNLGNVAYDEEMKKFSQDKFAETLEFYFYTMIIEKHYRY